MSIDFSFLSPAAESGRFVASVSGLGALVGFSPVQPPEPQRRSSSGTRFIKPHLQTGEPYFWPLSLLAASLTGWLSHFYIPQLHCSQTVVLPLVLRRGIPDMFLKTQLIL